MFPKIIQAIALSSLMIASQSYAEDLAELKQQGRIRVAVANEIPYGYLDLNAKPKGVGPEVAEHLLNQLGLKEIEWVATQFSSLIPGLKADRFDMVAAEMAILPQRCQVVRFSEPNSSYGEGLLVAKGNPKQLHSYQDFVTKEAKLAIMAGADQLEIMQALGVDERRLVMIKSNSDAISTLATGRADAYAATGLTAAQLAQKSDKVELASEFVDPIVKGETVRSWGGFVFSQQSPELTQAINDELAKFKQTPEWEAILTKYGFTPLDMSASSTKTTAQLCAK